MSRSVPYRREITDACNWHQEQALNSTIYILYQTGPTGFLLNEEGETKKFKVFLGDVHNCTCSVFKKEKDLCKHICWIILKKFRLPRDDPLTWQLGLNEREINQFIRGDTVQQRNKPSKSAGKQQIDKKTGEASSGTEQRPITDSDVCPICQDELLAKKLPVSYCRTCGNNVHIKCMKVWAEHQKSNGESELKCPLCREIFCTFDILDQEYRNNSLFKLEKEDLHYGLICQCCKRTPISGKCYKCTTCNEFYLCQPCFNTDFHNSHSFVFREKISQKYRKATRDHVGMLPQAIVHSLENRELSEQDYDLLLQLEPTNAEKKQFSSIPEKVIKSWKSEKVRENSQLLNPGVQCRICLRPYQPNQLVRKLPNCKHKYHAECIDNWLLHSHPTCPIDGLVVWDPITAQIEKEEKKEKLKKAPETKKEEVQQDLSLGILINYKTNVVEKSEAVKVFEKIKPKLNQRNHTMEPTKPPVSRVNNLRIEIEGKNVGFQQTDNIPQNRMILPRIDKKKVSHSQFLTGLTRNRSNSVEGLNIPGNVFNNLFNIQTLVNTKPYQLSRVSHRRDQSDFYDDEEEEIDEVDETENFKIEDYESIRSNLSVNKSEPTHSRNAQVLGSNLELNLNENQVVSKPPNPNNNLVRNRIKMKKLLKLNSVNTRNDLINDTFPLIQGVNMIHKIDHK